MNASEDRLPSLRRQGGLSADYADFTDLRSSDDQALMPNRFSESVKSA